MRDPLQKMLDFAVAESREAEALFKEWAPRVEDQETRALFSELAATERGRTEMLSRMVPSEIADGPDGVPDLGDFLIDIKAGRTTTLAGAVGLAVQRKGVTSALYDRIGDLGGEAGPFFRAMAAEDRRTVHRMETFAKQLTADASEESRPGGVDGSRRQ